MADNINILRFLTFVRNDNFLYCHSLHLGSGILFSKGEIKGQFNALN